MITPVKSFIERWDEVFASVTLTGAKNGGMCCVGSVSHAGISQVSSLSKMLTKGFVKAPTVRLDQGNRQALANGIGATMTTRCRIQLFYSTAIEAFRDDLLFSSITTWRSLERISFFTSTTAASCETHPV